MGVIRSSGNIPLSLQTMGTVPDVTGALQDYYQTVTFSPVTKTVTGFVVNEVSNPIIFRGVVTGFSHRELALKPEGQRAWRWIKVYSDNALTLKVDDVIEYLGKQYRVMEAQESTPHNFFAYHLVEDYQGSGPS